MKNLELIAENDEIFGNTWTTNLVFKDGTNERITGERPVQYFGVHGLVNLFKDEFHLLGEDDGNFQTITILSKEEILMLHTEMVELENEFLFKGHFKVKYKNKNILKDRKSGKQRISSLKIKDREQSAPLLFIGINDKTVSFDVNWLPDFVKVLDIN
jgi:hypothetical protein